MSLENVRLVVGSLVRNRTRTNEPCSNLVRFVGCSGVLQVKGVVLPTDGCRGRGGG